MGIRTVLHDFRALVAAIQGLVRVLLELVKLQQEAGPALSRLDALELSRHQFEAEVQGVLLKAEGKEKAARSSEQRERQLKRANEKFLDPLGANGEEVEEAGGDPVLALDAPGGEAERLHSLRLGLAPGPKAGAIRAKWGR